MVLWHQPRTAAARRLIIWQFENECRTSGLRLRIVRGKTEREGQGAEIGLPRGKHAETCPVRAFEAWQAAAKRQAGPLFRRISTGDRIGAGMQFGKSWRTVSAGPGSPSTDLIV